MRAWLLGIVLTSLSVDDRTVREGDAALPCRYAHLRPAGKPQLVRFVPYICLGFLRYDSGKGVLLIFLIGGGLFAGPEVRQIRRRAREEILGKISGVGKVDVMLSLHSGGERVLAQDSSLRYSGSVQSPDSYERSTQPVTDGGGVVVTKETCPQNRGALGGSFHPPFRSRRPDRRRTSGFPPGSGSPPGPRRRLRFRHSAS